MNRITVIHLLEDLRSVLVRSVAVAALLAAGSFIFSRQVMLLLANDTHTKLYYFSISEVFMSAVELAIYMGLFLSVPVVTILVWRKLRQCLAGTMDNFWFFVIVSMLLFYAGCVFCYFFVLPSGIGFLLSYEGYGVKAMISTARFVRFCTAMIFAFGAAFELPIILLVLEKFRIVTIEKLARARRYAVLIIVVAASVITPTPDIYNMSLLAGPLYLLYEASLLVMKMRRRSSLTGKGKSV